MSFNFLCIIVFMLVESHYAEFLEISIIDIYCYKYTNLLKRMLIGEKYPNPEIKKTNIVSKYRSH